MKKLLVLLSLLLVGSFSFAENIVSLNASPITISFSKGTSNDRDVGVFEYIFAFQGEYNYLFPNNMLLGAMFGLGVGNVYDFREGSNAYMSAASFNVSYAPEIGMRFGKRHLFSLIFQPIGFSHSMVSKGTLHSTNNNISLTKEDIDYAATYNTFKSGLKMNFQWGNNLCRNGFYYGIFFPWYKSITNEKYEGINFSDEKLELNTFPIEISIGYRMSFIF